MKRAQSRDVHAAIAAKETQAETAARAAAAKAAQAQAAAPPKFNPKAKKCPELRGKISVINGVKKIWFLKCKKNVNYTGWSDHCTGKHTVDGPATKEDEGAIDPDIVQPEPAAP